MKEIEKFANACVKRIILKLMSKEQSREMRTGFNRLCVG